ncbi:MAG: hypothetical protein JWL94_1488 [Microbacteriaceae bacterium]|jgi:hypothetical protein|nr:hypothetical protein [Microbacteriaceae bacterium]
MTVLTPTVRQGTRSSLFWLATLVFVILAAIGSLLLVGASSDNVTLSPSNPAADGTMAVVEVLNQQGVDVTVTTSLAETGSAITDPASTTVVLHDPDQLLAEGQHARLLESADNLVLLDPGFIALQSLAPDVHAAGAPEPDVLVAGCALPAAVRGGEVSSGGSAYRVDADARAETCLRHDDDNDNDNDTFSLVRLDVDGVTVSVLGATEALTNGEITARGNAAFALGLLGEDESLVWYLPSVTDLDGAGDSAALTPGWLTPAILLLAITASAAALWRGRRFGPLIIENLPVMVRASETMEGRARLYQKGSARLRALDALRIGAIMRLATVCGLPTSASVEEVVLGVAGLLGRNPPEIRTLLVDATPASDSELVHFSDRLLELEAAASAAART